MPEFVRENIRLSELAGRSEAAPQFVEKAQVNVDLFVFGAIERAGGGRRTAASRLRAIAEKD